MNFEQVGKERIVIQGMFFHKKNSPDFVKAMLTHWRKKAGSLKYGTRKDRP